MSDRPPLLPSQGETWFQYPAFPQVDAPATRFDPAFADQDEPEGTEVFVRVQRSVGATVVRNSDCNAIVDRREHVPSSVTDDHEQPDPQFQTDEGGSNIPSKESSETPSTASGEGIGPTEPPENGSPPTPAGPNGPEDDGHENAASNDGDDLPAVTTPGSPIEPHTGVHTAVSAKQAALPSNSSEAPTEADKADDKTTSARPSTRLVKLLPLAEERQIEAEAHERRVELYRSSERATAADGWRGWAASDSPLENGPNSFASWFEAAGLVPEGQTFREYIETSLTQDEHRKAIEIGGLGSHLFGGFSDGFFESTVAVTLTDTRDVGGLYSPTTEKDQARNHSVIEGDILAPGTLSTIDDDWLEGDRVSLIISRMHGAVPALSNDPYTLGALAASFYSRLTDNGMMFVQLPENFPVQMLKGWQTMLAQANPAVELQLGEFDRYPLLRLQKHPGAPSELPLIPARTLMEERNRIRRAIP